MKTKILFILAVVVSVICIQNLSYSSKEKEVKEVYIKCIGDKKEVIEEDEENWEGFSLLSIGDVIQEEV